MGLRELKKEQTRQHTAGTAWQLFIDRGFDQVSVAEVARAAQVAEATVFNYFPSKEDLFYSRLQAFWTRPAGAGRVPGCAAGRRWPARRAGVGRPGRAGPAAHGEQRRRRQPGAAGP